MSHKRRKLGNSGEVLASKYLRQQGYHILAHNFRTKIGEIDIIVSREKTIVFVEVKTTKTDFLDSPLDAVTPKKQQQISKVALEYLASNDLFNLDARFDVIAVKVRPLRSPHIEHIENAFDLRYG